MPGKNWYSTHCNIILTILHRIEEEHDIAKRIDYVHFIYFVISIQKSVENKCGGKEVCINDNASSMQFKLANKMNKRVHSHNLILPLMQMQHFIAIDRQLILSSWNSTDMKGKEVSLLHDRYEMI